ncbi:GNAT family N-acetyltransferase [Companilactobacillus ginsenosidimutans]|uniref:GCN5 family acetyltransferase n=1 Tax=Companilactobacillus ginsenosidimutans TaxID=1007676 RepID=A0A0H4QMA5_9LACO|nr:GNAT family protein [Companilactobacillus ginsenosidimutans]AKP68236.1 GCN5 family acetyltransferase [Companilactobacillus ginsenosidimutans]
MSNIYLRKANLDDLDAIMDIINEAKALLKKDGSTQWQNGSPNREKIEKDIDLGFSNVLIVDGEIAATAALYTTPDPTYAKIYDGAWSATADPYATTHTVAISSKFRGMHLSKFLFSNLTTLAVEKGFHNLRIDTHEMNVRMQRLAKSFGYVQRGIIYIDSTPEGKRLAFELNL